MVQEQQQASQSRLDPDKEEPTYCPICYTNEIVPPDKPVPQGDKNTVEFDCKHRFCSECTIEQFKGLIEKAEIKKLKCFDFECTQPDIPEAKIEAILSERDMGELLEKYKRFRD